MAFIKISGGNYEVLEQNNGGVSLAESLAPAILLSLSTV